MGCVDVFTCEENGMTIGRSQRPRWWWWYRCFTGSRRHCSGITSRLHCKSSPESGFNSLCPGKQYENFADRRLGQLPYIGRTRHQKKVIVFRQT